MWAAGEATKLIGSRRRRLAATVDHVPATTAGRFGPEQHLHDVRRRCGHAAGVGPRRGGYGAHDDDDDPFLRQCEERRILHVAVAASRSARPDHMPLT